ELLVRRDELRPADLGVATLAAGDVRGEVFDVDLPPNPVERQLVQWQTVGLDDQDGLIAVGRQRGLKDRVELLRQFSRCHHQPLWRLAGFAPPRPFPTGSMDQQTEVSAKPEVTVDLAVPTGQTARIYERRPQIVDVGVETVLHAHDAPAVLRSQAAQDSG